MIKKVGDSDKLQGGVSKLFNNKTTIDINKKLLVLKKLKEQDEQNRINEAIRQAEKEKIDLWWIEEKKKIVPWTDEQRAFYEKHTFSPDEKSSERYNRLMTNTWKKLENR
jgi:hypothetical protein